MMRQQQQPHAAARADAVCAASKMRRESHEIIFAGEKKDHQTTQK